MTDGKVVSLRPDLAQNIDELAQQAKDKGVTKAILVGIDADEMPFYEVTGKPTHAELCWLAKILDDRVTAVLRAP